MMSSTQLRGDCCFSTMRTKMMKQVMVAKKQRRGGGIGGGSGGVVATSSKSGLSTLSSSHSSSLSSSSSYVSSPSRSLSTMALNSMSLSQPRRGSSSVQAHAFPDLSLVGEGASPRVGSDVYGMARPRKPKKPERLPDGQVRYEIMVVLRPDLSEEEWEEELARFESSLDKAGVTEIDSLVRGRQRMAYPIKGCVYGLYVLYTFIGTPQVGRAVQAFFNAPDLRPQKPILRYMVHRTQ